MFLLWPAQTPMLNLQWDLWWCA